MDADQTKSPRAILDDDHKRIDALLTKLLAAVRADDREGAAKEWSRVEDALLRHFDVEEMFVFPALASTHAVEVDALKREHDEMRCTLGEIGLAFDLHTARCAPIEGLCQRLRDHAERESALAYVEAERKLHVTAARSLLQRLKRFASSLPLDGIVAMGDQP